MSFGQAGADDGGLGRALSDVSQQRRERVAEAKQREAVETAHRDAHVRMVKRALAVQDETTRKAVATFRQKAARIAPQRAVPIGSTRKRRFVPFAIEIYHEPLYEDAHLIYDWSCSYSEESRV